MAVDVPLVMVGWNRSGPVEKPPRVDSQVRVDDTQHLDAESRRQIVEHLRRLADQIETGWLSQPQRLPALDTPEPAGATAPRVAYGR